MSHTCSALPLSPLSCSCTASTVSMSSSTTLNDALLPLRHTDEQTANNQAPETVLNVSGACF